MIIALLPEDTASVPHQWFEAQLGRQPENAVHKVCLEAEVAALKDFHDGKTSIDEAAKAITQPISNSSIQDLGGYSDDCKALCHLWNLLTKALIEWPSSRTPDLIGLLSAMSKVTDPIHRGQLLNDNDEDPCPWSQLPYLTMVWSDGFWMTPGQISRRATDAAGRSHARVVHVKQQDVEAQLVAAGILKWRRPFQYIIRTLETAPGPHDEIDAAGDAEAEFQLKLDLQIPAVANWIRHNGQRLYNDIGELEGWHEMNIPAQAIQFDQPKERWTFWQKRLLEVANDRRQDDETRKAARVAIEHMRNVNTGH